ncbi:MAG: hypothetical protein KF823_08400 [Xanthomonadales bacterium]|nr:hypothetical protein [Xanthomonadales bacterium]
MNLASPRLLAPLLAVALVALAPAPAVAAMFCVGTGVQFQNALSTAETNGVDDEIRIRTGTLIRDTPMASGFIYLYSSNLTQDLDISGGWNATCTQQTHDPRLTVLSGAGLGQVLGLGHYGAGGAGTIRLRNLSLRNGRGTSSGFGIGLQVTAWEGANGAAELEHLLIQLNDNHAPVIAGSALRLMDATGGRLDATVRNVQIDGNRNRGVVVDSANALSVYRITQSTVTANLVIGPGFAAVEAYGPGFLWVANNVFAGNGVATDFAVGSTPSHLRNNHIGGLSGSPGSNQGMTSGDPRLVADGVWWRPGVGSPLRDTGIAAPNGGTGTLDIAGNPRVRGPAVDRGAYEAAPDLDTIWRNGFQGN